MKKYGSWIFVIVVVALIIGGMVWSATKPREYDKFATCIKDSGATFFGAFWCPHCHEQKALFGPSVDKLPYFECSTPDGSGQTQDCIKEDIKSYPTWKFKDGSVKTGVIPLVDLAKFTGCELKKDQE
jgi:hypothetical protein